MSVLEPTPVTAKKPARDRELPLLLGGFGLLWLLVGGFGYSLIPVIKCLSMAASDSVPACTGALDHPVAFGELRAKILRLKLDGHMTASTYDDALKTSDELINLGYAGFDVYMQRGNARRSKGDVADAAKEFRKALEIDAQNTDAFAALMRLHVDGRFYDEGRRDAQSFVQANPESALALSWLGWVNQLDGKLPDAIANYKTALVKDPNDPWLHYELGQILAKDNNAAEALKEYSVAIDADGSNTSFLIARAQLHHDHDRHSEAQADFLQALNVTREFDAIHGLAKSYINDRKYLSAAPLIEEALGLDASDERIHDSKIRWHYLQRDFMGAIAAIAALRSAVPDSVYATYWTASIDDEVGRDEAALAGYLKVIAAWPSDQWVRADAGHLLLDLGRKMEAVAYFDQAIELSPRTAMPYVGRARAHIFLENWPAAIADADVALQFEPANGVAHARRARAEWGLGHMDAARKDYAEAVRLSPQSWVAEEYVELLISMKDFDMADVQIAAMLAADPNSASALELREKLKEERAKPVSP